MGRKKHADKGCPDRIGSPPCESSAVPAGRKWSYSRLGVGLLLVVLTGGVFSRSLNCGFVDLDDNKYVVENSRVTAGLTWDGVRWAFRPDYENSVWQPITWLSYMLDCELFGPGPWGFHLTNVIFHALSAGLLFAVLVRMTQSLWRSALVAALFAIHPLRVESVVWVAERKDVLSVFFGLLTLWFYVRYVERPGWRAYGLMVAAFGLGLSAKPMLVTLPLVMLLLDYWPLRRTASLQRRVLEKWPIFGLAAMSGIVTYFVHRAGGSLMLMDNLSASIRFQNAAVAYVVYLRKTFWPSDLAVFYPHPGAALPVWQAVGSALILVVLTAVVVRLVGRYPYLAVGWFWFLATMAPMIGIVQTGGHALADRFTYFPSIGILLALTWSLPEWTVRGIPRRRAACLAVPAGLILMALGICTWRQIGHWKDAESLFRHTLRVTRNNYKAHQMLGINRVRAGRMEEGMGHLYEAIRIMPGDFEAQNNLGIALASQNRTEEAINHFRRAIELCPMLEKAYYNLGNALLSQRKIDEAIGCYQKAIQLRPDYGMALSNLAFAYSAKGRHAEAWKAYHASRRSGFNPPAALYRQLTKKMPEPREGKE